METVEQLVARRRAEILALFEQKSMDAQERRADRLARQQVESEQQKLRDADPQAWVDRMVAARSDGLALTWPGCGAATNLGVRRGVRGFSIGPEGWYWSPGEGMERLFVSGPCYLPPPTSSATLIAFRAGSKWKTVTCPRPSQRNGLDVRHRAHVVESAARDGLKLAQRVEWRDGNGQVQHEQPVRLLVAALFGVAADGARCFPAVQPVKSR